MATMALSTSAHDNPGDVVHALTHRIETDGPTARILAARAFEYTFLRQWDQAVSDFDAALELQPSYGVALTGLAQALSHQENFSRAEAVAKRGLELDIDPARQAPFWAALAEIHTVQADWSPALYAWRQALKSPRPEVDWYLSEADCLAHLDRYTERVSALAEATTRNPSVVLHRSWIRALVDAGALDDASREIELGLAGARWKSSWLLLRARVHAQRQERAQQESDAEAALAEIRQRWNPKQSDQDPILVADAGLAFALLGQDTVARELMDKARAQGVSESHLTDLEQLIGEASLATP
tara:strand:+ start:241 stop:1137 length:897 start_codon:yes stop_codon:yes gene_type:complete